MKKYVSLVLCLLLAALLFTGCAGGNGGSSGGGKTSDAAVNEALLGCFGKSADEAVKALGLKDGQKAGDYGYTLDWLDGFFLKRPAYAAAHLAEEFDLTGSLETVTVTTAHPEMGSVTVNPSRIDLSTGSWSGQYFTDYPITVTAAANDGYEFVGWKGDADGAGETVTVSVDGGIALEAVFAKVQ